MIESKVTHGKVAYSVNSILETTDDDSALDLSLKQGVAGVRLITDDKNYTDPTPVREDDSHAEKINQLFLNIFQQREFNKRFQCSANDAIHHARCSYDKSSKVYNTATGMPWNFLRPVHQNIPTTGNNLFHQFQNIIFNKRAPSQPIIPGSVYHRPNFKNIFSQSSAISPNDTTNSYFHNLSQIFNTRINVPASIDNPQYINVGGDNFNGKPFPSSNIELNTHFSLQNILKSTSNRKRKRTKVTDTRLPRRTSTDQHFNSYTQIPDPIVAELPRFQTFIRSPTDSSQSSHSEETHGDPKKYTLTPIHLRKAKLMFLYTRYPNSQMLKSYFPDITFCKQNTAQLVKWFSNFREFYYSEMEKAVQRALSNGTQNAKDIDVTVDSELFKNLMTHFNKKKQIVVPCEFLTTVQITLREFFDAISTGKNLHQSWKKPIYKNIAKLDQPLPDFFKDMHWMMELAKDENENISN